MSAWMDHVKATRKANPKTQLKEVLKMASKTYKKGLVTAKKGKKGNKGKKGKKGNRTKKRRN